MPVVDLGPRLIDTSVWIRSDRKGHEALRARLKELLVAGFVSICWPIRAELLIGVKTPERWTSLDEQLAALEQVSTTEEHGHGLPAWATSWIGRDKAFRCPICSSRPRLSQHSLPLWTVDGDFKRIATVAPLYLDWFGAD